MYRHGIVGSLLLVVLVPLRLHGEAVAHQAVTVEVMVAAGVSENILCVEVEQTNAAVTRRPVTVGQAVPN